MTVVTRFVQAVSHGGLMSRPTLIVIHDAETPLKAGYAKSIAENWFGKAATTSAHFMVDPVETIRLLSDNVVSYAVGPKANGFTLNIEQAGYASFTRAQWTTSDGMVQHARVGALVRELSGTHGIPLRWASDAQILAASRGVPGGVCYHDDIRRVLGGTTHHDPMPNYPGDLLEQAWGGVAKTPSLPGDDMAVISSPGRGTAVVGPGYFRQLNAEEAGNTAPFGPVVQGNDRQFDLWRSMALGGTTAVWSTTVSRTDATTDGKTMNITAIQELADAKTQAAAVNAQLAGFQAALAAADTGKGGVDVDAIRAAVDAAVRDSIQSIDVTVNTKAAQ